MSILGNSLEILYYHREYNFFKILNGFIAHERYQTDNTEDEITVFINIYTSTLTCKIFFKGREIVR